MQDPLKQGLKLSRVFRDGPKPVIRMQDPLKQGLKLLEFERVLVFVFRFECKIH